MAMGGNIPKELQQEAIRRLLASPQFASAESLRRIVTTLFEHAQTGAPGSLREQQIAIEALGRPADFDPRIDPIVRVSIASIRERIRDFFENSGRDEPVKVSLPKGQYRLQFELQRNTGGAPASDSARARFWQPYLSPANPNLLIYSEVLFFRDDEGNYIRNIYVNDRSVGLAEIRQRLRFAQEPSLTPSFHFMPAGEMSAILSINQVFSALGASLETRNSRFFSWTDARRANLILIGSARTNPFVRSLQGDLPLTITPMEIRLSNPRPGEATAFSGKRYQDGELERLVEYALITRRTGPVQGTTVTMISANHGRAIEGAGRYLAEESHLRGLEEALNCSSLQGSFQLVLRVEMLDFDEEVVDVAYVTHRMIAGPS